jgi:hypothetical protein
MTGASIWGFYGFVRLAVVGLIAMRIQRSDEAGQRVVQGLIKAGALVRTGMTATAVAVSIAMAFWIGL